MAYGITRGDAPQTRPACECSKTRVWRSSPPAEKAPLDPAERAARIIAAALTVMLACTFSCTPTALATTGVTSNIDVDMDYYWASNQSHSKHYLHKLGDWWVYCVDPYNGFFEGYTYTGEDPVKTGKLSQDCVTDLALAYKYVWDEGLYRTPDGKELANDYERYAAAQVLIWTIIVDYYPSLGPHHNRITVKGKDVTGDGDTDANNKAAYKWIAAHRGDYIGHCEYFDAGSRQSFAMAFVSEPVTGSIVLVKHSSNPGATSGNSHYSLEGARYGVYADKDCTDREGELVTDADGIARLDDVPVGTHYVKEIKAPAGFALDGTVYKVEVESGKTANVGGSAGVVDVAQSGSITISKKSANESISQNNACYTLEGAEYGIFSDGACTARVGSLAIDASGSARVDDLPLGTYYVKETKAPCGFAVDTAVYSVEVNPDGATQVNGSAGVAEKPQHAQIELFAMKRDSQTPEGNAQGAATLAGAQFTISYYDGYFSADSLPASPLRTWVVQTDEDGCARADDEHLVGGDELYHSLDGKVALPLGTYSIQETAAPGGYRLGSGGEQPQAQVVHVKANNATGPIVDAFEPAEQADDVQRGGVAVGKVDRQNGQFLPQGSATLAEATFEIVSDNDQLVMVDGTVFAPGSVVKTIQTALEENRYIARTEIDCLPVGSYTIREVGAPEGYLLDEASASWEQSFAIESDGMLVDFTQEEDAIDDQVIRGDFEFSKIDGQSAERLAKVPFLVTSDTTGEAHVLVTDENGMASTSAEWNAHTHATNANDAALVEQDGKTTVDSELLDASAGIWFNGRADAECAPDDELGALPYDTYTIAELPCAANENLELVSFTTVISRNNREIDLGTVDDNAGPTLATSLADGNGAKLVAAEGDAILVDTVAYANLKPEHSYTLAGQLHAIDGEGQDLGVIAEGSAELIPSTPSGSTEVIFSFDASQFEFDRLVATEQLLDAEGEIVCAHEDLSDEAQTVYMPSIETTLDRPDDAGEISSVGTIELVDTVRYTGLVPARTYTLEACLHMRGDDGSDEGAALDASGQPIRATQSFTPAQSSGEVAVTFVFEAPSIAGRTVVAFEELLFKDVTYAVHADISDDGQSMTFPRIGTTLTGPAGAKQIDPSESTVLVDTVSYSNLVAGNRYSLMGTLHVTDESGADLGVMRDERGAPIVAKTLFTPEEANGTAKVEFHLDTSDLGAMSLVAFEVLLNDEGKVIASHEDASDGAQAVLVNIPEEDEPELEPEPEPEDELDEPAPKTPTKKLTNTPVRAGKTTPKAGTVAKTGDTIPLFAFALIPAAALALGLSALAVWRMRQHAPVSVPRGQHRRIR